MKLYSGIDLHSTNSYLAIIDENLPHRGRCLIV